jgi:hypothetical protein
MMRLIVTFLLSTFFLLVRGNAHLYAHATHDRTCYCPAQLPEKSKDAVSANQSQNNITKACTNSTSNDGFNATELEDEDDFIAFRKFVEVTNYFLSFFYAHVLGNDSQYVKNRLPVCEHFSYSSSCKYIMQRVIRI